MSLKFLFVLDFAGIQPGRILSVSGISRKCSERIKPCRARHRAVYSAAAWFIGAADGEKRSLVHQHSADWTVSMQNRKKNSSASSESDASDASEKGCGVDEEDFETIKLISNGAYG